MPLPTNGSLSLQGHSKPGESTQSKPLKQAMLVRMSAETLEALSNFQNQPQMDFEFGENPGIYIGDTFFPMRGRQENTPHDLYLRASSAAKPMAPLKLYATVTGKFTVERDLSKVTSKVRESTLDAAQQRSARQLIVLQTPPTVAAPNGKKKKPAASSLFRKPIQSKDVNKSSLPPPSTSLPARVASPAPRPSPRPPVTKEALIAIRKRLVHCLAVAERTSDEVVKLVAGPDADASSKRDLLGLLEEVADQSSTKNGGKSAKWRLKPESWMDVRPYEWPKLTEAERTSMVLTARQAFATLKLPDNDPAWEHVRLRPSTDRSSASSSSNGVIQRVASQNGQSATDAPKRNAPPVDTKKKARPKNDPADVGMKDERVVSTSRPINGKEKRGANPSPSLPAKSLATSRRPGSGFKLPKHAPQDGHSDTTGSPPAPSPAPRPKPVDVRRKELPPSLPAKPVPPISPPERKPNGAIHHRVKKSQEYVASDSDRPRKETDRVRGRVRDRERERDSDWDMDWESSDRARDRENPRTKQDAPSGSLKRKKQPRDLDEQEYMPSRSTSIKRQKVDGGDRHASSSRDDGGAYKISVQQKDESVVNSPRPKPTVRRNVSPAAEPRPKREVSPPRRQSDHPPSKSTSVSRASKQRISPSPKPHKSSNPTKHRRRSPIYTTTEDEADEPPPKSEPLPTPPMTTRPSHSGSRHARSLPTDHASLRARYSSSYLRYLNTFQKVVAQKGKIENMLKHGIDGSIASITDSDSDVELMDAEDLARLVSDHRRQQEELETIQQEFARVASG